MADNVAIDNTERLITMTRELIEMVRLLGERLAYVEGRLGYRLPIRDSIALKGNASRG